MRSDYFLALSISSDRFHLDLPVFIKKQLRYALRIGLFKKNWGKLQGGDIAFLNLKLSTSSLTTFQFVVLFVFFWFRLFSFVHFCLL